MSLDEYPNKIEIYLKDIIINLQNSDAWKIQLTIAINIIYSKDTEEERVLHLNSDIIKFTSYSESNNVIKKLFKLLRSKYQVNLETSMKGSNFTFDSVQLMHYKCHKVEFKRDGSYIDSPNWLKNKKATINPKDQDDKCFQYVATVALNFDEIESRSERVSNIKLFMNKYNWEGINYPSKLDDSKTFEKNNAKISPTMFYTKEKEICPTCISNTNSTREKQIILLMISNEGKKGWHYLEVKHLSALLRGITSKHHGDF